MVVSRSQTTCGIYFGLANDERPTTNDKNSPKECKILLTLC